jgi:hypothetical protein
VIGVHDEHWENPIVRDYVIAAQIVAQAAPLLFFAELSAPSSGSMIRTIASLRNLHSASAA